MTLLRKNKQFHRGSLPILIAIFVMALILIASGVTAAAVWGDRTGVQNSNTTGLGGVDCSGVASLTPEQYQWVKDAAGKYLGGDEAALISVIQVESGWNAQAQNSTSSASGLGQFITSTAKGFPEFVGGDDKHGTVWPAGQVYDDPSSHADDARFDAHRAIFASAHLLSGKIAQYGSLGEAYEKGYHGGSTPDQIQAAKEARVKLEKIYQAMTNGGGCKSTIIAGVLDVPLIPQIQDGFCGRASQAMVAAYFHKDNLATYDGAAFQNAHQLNVAASVKSLSGQSYVLSNSIDTAIASLAKGPVIAYTGLYNNQHIIVLTGYDSTTQTFYANDPYPNGTGGKNVQKIGSVALTRANMVVTTALGTSIYGHAPFILIP